MVSQDSACYKIIRKWRVIDWCQYEQRTGAGQWEGTQVIQVKNSEAPNIFSCQDTIFNDKEAYRDPISNLCYGHYDMTALGDDDCTPEVELIWSYKIDIHDDGTYEPEQKGSRAMGVLPVDTHRIRWIVQDKCGNYSQCDRLFVIRDDKKPTPYCKSGIVTVVMQTNGQVLVKAIDLEQNSFDNCTEHSKLVFSFSSDTTIKTILYTCDSLEGQTVINKTVRLYVTDEAGNQDFCETFVRIQDNNNACNNTGIVVSGGIFNMRNEPMLGAQVSVERSSDHQILYSVLSDGAGEYTFQDVKAALFEINAEMGDYITNGVTTYDIVLLQKHILGISEIKDPFKLMAADVNKTNNLTARDISEIRKVILGVSSQFSGVPIWQFVDKRFKYNQQVGWTNAPNKILSSSLNGIYKDVDFVGIKSGDIDQSANFGNQNGIVRQNETRTWKLIKEENNHRVAVVSTQKQLISGFQLALQIGSTQAYNLESGKIQILSDDYLELQQQLRISWAAKSDVSVEKDDVLFYIKSSGSSIPSFELSEIWMPAQVYDAAGNQYSIKLIPNEEYQEKIGSLVLYQNTPNPFSLSTTINFEINVDCEAKLEVFSMTGKKVLSRLMQAKAGINPLIILKSDLDGSGMFYYQIEAKGQKKAQKMILID
ncbi:MAG: T9SS type A sorting domain-containing protein [Saprospiraceae bacterium]|nr:T9SS type A sorting domain-containing protein [Saprospiraceae bacterium]